MGKWETNIGNTVKNNSAGRVIIGGVAKKISVVREVVGGVVKQVWNAFDPNLPNVQLPNIWIQDGSGYYTNAVKICDKAKYDEAVANGYTSFSAHYSMYDEYSEAIIDLMIGGNGHYNVRVTGGPIQGTHSSETIQGDVTLTASTLSPWFNLYGQTGLYWKIQINRFEGMYADLRNIKLTNVRFTKP